MKKELKDLTNEEFFMYEVLTNMCDIVMIVFTILGALFGGLASISSGNTLEGTISGFLVFYLIGLVLSFIYYKRLKKRFGL